MQRAKRRRYVSQLLALLPGTLSWPVACSSGDECAYGQAECAGTSAKTCVVIDGEANRWSTRTCASADLCKVVHERPDFLIAGCALQADPLALCHATAESESACETSSTLLVPRGLGLRTSDVHPLRQGGLYWRRRFAMQHGRRLCGGPKMHANRRSRGILLPVTMQSLLTPLVEPRKLNGCGRRYPRCSDVVK